MTPCHALLPVLLGRVPIVVQRPLAALVARCPLPSVLAPRAAPAGRKRVPLRTACVEEGLGGAKRAAPPTARCRGTPRAQRTADAAEQVLVGRSKKKVGNLVRRLGVSQKQLK